MRSFADSDGDGVGDLAGIREKLGYLHLLGVDALWLTPFYPSPMVDHGYDVADPRDVDPLFGNLADFDALVADAHALGPEGDDRPGAQPHLGPARGLRGGAGGGAGQPGAGEVRLPRRARVGRRASRRTTGTRSSAARPGPGSPDGQWYLHLFAAEQPDLDWTNPAVAADLETTMRFWLDRGVDGFRIDVAHGMAKAAGLPDMDRPERRSTVPDPEGGQDPRFDVEEVHDVHRLIRRVLDSYPDRVSVGEVWVHTDERLARYVRPDELNLAFNFRLLQADWDAAAFRDAIVDSLAAMDSVGAPTTWVLSNHDVVRHASRYARGTDEQTGRRRARAAALVQLALPGVAFVYYGDELALPNVELPDEALQDPVWERSGHQQRGRDGERVPMPWSGEKPPYEFSTAAKTWLPMPDSWADLTVEAQLEDPDSTLSLYRRALELRHDHPGFGGPGLEWFTGPEGCLAFRRPGGLLCALNASAEPVPMPPGEILLASGPVGEDGTLPPDTTVWLV